MTTKITPEQIYQARSIMRRMPINRVGAGHPMAGEMDAAMTSWYSAARHDARIAAEELLLAGIIANEQDGDPDDYMGAAAAIRAHYAAVTDGVVDAQIQCGYVGTLGTSARWECARMDGHDGDHTPITPPTPSPIPADATGLKGKRAKIVGPLRHSWGAWTQQGIDACPVGTEVVIRSDSVKPRGDVHIDVGDTPQGADLRIAASSLALIPGPEVVRCGGRYSDDSRCVLDDGHDSGCRYPFIPEPEAAGGGQLIGDTDTLPEPPVGTRLRDSFGLTWVLSQIAPNSTGWHTTPTAGPVFAWDELRDQGGPLHQVWTDGDSVPVGVSVRDALGGLRRWTRDSDRVWTCAETPFVAVEEFGAAQ